MKVKRFVGLFLVCVLSVSSFTSCTDVPVNRNWGTVCAVYYPLWENFNMNNIRGELMTDLLLSFAEIDDSDHVSLVLTDFEPKVSYVEALSNRYPDLRISLSIGGSSERTEDFKAMSADSSLRSKFVSNVKQFLSDHLYITGIDIDWEYPKKDTEISNYINLLKDLRAMLAGIEKQTKRAYRLTTALPPDRDDLMKRMTEIADTLDGINIMLYDFAGGWSSETGHNSPFAGKPSIKSGVQSYLDSGVPAEKLILGMAFYGYYWKGCIEENTTNGLGVSVPRESRTVSMISYKEIGQKLKLAAWEQYWDDEAQCPYMYNPTEKSFISYTDVKEINLITAYAKKKELGGVMAWEYTQDNSTRELLNAMYSGILK